MKRLHNFFLTLVCLWLASGFIARAANTNSLVWHKTADRVDADIRGEALWPLLEQIAAGADWKVFVEPGTEHNASAKFKNLPSGDALKMLLGDLNFALVPQTNSPSQLYVFRTTMQNATKQVRVSKTPRRVANELLVRVKPGTDIDALAKLIGAKVIGRMDKLGVYLLQFGNATATDAALAQLQNDSDVLAVDYNDYLDPPPVAQPISSSIVPAGYDSQPTLTLTPPTSGDPCSPIIGMLDTPQSSVSTSPSVLPSISVMTDSGSGASPQSIGNPVEVFAPKQVSAASSAAVPTHGTAMIQTILRAISQSSGGSSSARILPVDVYGSGESTTSWNVALGIQAAVNHGATILNMSLGGSSDSSVLDSVIQQALADGIVIFAAAGNTPVNTPTYPAAIPGVNDVTALGSPGHLAAYADFSPQVNMALPGASIVYVGNQAYVVQGTSPATAYASGVAAGTKSVNCLTWKEILSVMQAKFPVPGK
jgi:Subtilase family